MPRGSKPGERRGGRKRGTPNKFSGKLKEMVLEALERAGGTEGSVAYLERRARDEHVAFMGLLGKILPTQVAGDPDNPIKTVTEIRVSFVRPKDRTSGNPTG